MADIAQDLRNIEEARYGREVRSSIHDAIRDINIDAEHAVDVAETSQESAYNNANKAESYAVGGTGTRTGEDTDNAKYYAELAERSAGVFVVEDNLESTSTIHSLSANQGRVLDGKISTINGKVGEPNGIASLDAEGRLPYSQLPESAVEFKGTWDASTNTPTLTQGVGTNGDFYIVSVAGVWDSISFAVNDRIIFDGEQELWVRLGAGAGEVISVNNKSGVVTLNADDIPFDGTGSPLVSTNTEDAIKEAASTGGMIAKFNITSDVGSTVTVTMPSGTTVTATQKTGSTTEWEAETIEYGVHTITATLNNDTITDTVNVDTCKKYIVFVTSFSATITANYPTGATCTCVGGSESYTATTNPQVFTVHSADTYTITATDGTYTDTETVVITTDEQSESVTLSFVPDGSTVTPANDVQIWLNCADIWDKEYTSLSDILADTTTLNALIASQNAVDYMVRSTTWTTDICTNQTAMSYIGLDNYCANTLLANNTWSSAICNSTYFESVLNVKVPTLNSTSAAIISDGYWDTNYPFYAFDNSSSTYWSGSRYQGYGYIGYAFLQNVSIKRVDITTNQFIPWSDCYMQVSQDGTTWDTSIQQNIGAINANASSTRLITISGSYRYWRLYGSSSNRVGASTLQFYGREDV